MIEILNRRCHLILKKICFRILRQLRHDLSHLNRRCHSCHIALCNRQIGLAKSIFNLLRAHQLCNSLLLQCLDILLKLSAVFNVALCTLLLPLASLLMAFHRPVQCRCFIFLQSSLLRFHILIIFSCQHGDILSRLLLRLGKLPGITQMISKGIRRCADGCSRHCPASGGGLCTNLFQYNLILRYFHDLKTSRFAFRGILY